MFSQTFPPAFDLPADAFVFPPLGQGPILRISPSVFHLAPDAARRMADPQRRSDENGQQQRDEKRVVHWCNIRFLLECGDRVQGFRLLTASHAGPP
jgi:hypothetical protein